MGLEAPRAPTRSTLREVGGYLFSVSMFALKDLFVSIRIYILPRIYFMLNMCVTSVVESTGN